MAQLSSRTFVQRTSPGISIVGATVGGTGGAGAGSSAVDGIAGASIDISRYGGALFIGHVTQGGTGGAVSFSVRQTTAAITANTSGGQGTTLVGTTSTIAAGSSATSDTFVIDVYRPRQGYGSFMHSQLSVASSCSFLGPQFAIGYDPVTAATAALTTDTVPQSTAAGSTGGSGITGGVVRAVSPST
jgi:hypothetical protein